MRTARVCGAGAVVVALAIAIPSARADGPDFMVYAGPSASPSSALVPPASASCDQCAVVAPPTERPAQTSGGPMATVAIGLVGSEGYVHGGGEVFAILGFGDNRNSGYTGAVTYAGMETACWFARAGLGLGAYYGGDRGPGALDRLAGNALIQLGWRLTERVSLVPRLDIIVDDEATNPIGSIGLSWTPDR